MSCPGSDRAWDAAEPNWLKQADEQLDALHSTLQEIGDPSLLEAWDAFEDALKDVERRRALMPGD